MSEPFPRWKAYAIALFTLLVPGLAHWFLGKRARAAAFFGIVAATFLSGVALHGALFPFSSANWLFRLGAIAQLGLGAPYFVGRFLGWGQLGLLDMADQMFGYGNAFLVTAGLMNMLLMMDAFDIAVGRKE
jgi:hypothetical protein